MHIKSIDSKQAAKVATIMAFISVLMLTYPLAGAAWAFSVKLPHKHFMVLLFVPFFYALATYFLVGLGCILYRFSLQRGYLTYKEGKRFKGFSPWRLPWHGVDSCGF
jgi:Ni/Fe-hydrogenase subunit HybB-like protein